MRAFLHRLFTPSPRCGALCQQVEEELAALSLSRNLETMAREARDGRS